MADRDSQDGEEVERELLGEQGSEEDEEREVEALLVGDDLRAEPLGSGGRTEKELEAALTLALLAAAQPALQKEICVVRPPVAPDSLQVVAVVWHAIQVGIEQCAANLAREWQIATMRA